MAKRFTDTMIWKTQRWFKIMPPNYKLAFFYIKDNCSHSGLWRIDTVTLMEDLIVENFDLEDFVKNCNKDFDKFTGKPIEKERLLIVDRTYIWLTGHIQFEWESKLKVISPLVPAIKSALLELLGIGVLERAVNKGYITLTEPFDNSYETLIKVLTKGKETIRDRDRDNNNSTDNNLTVTELSVVNNGEKKFSENGHSEKMPISMKMKSYWMDKNPKYPVSDELDLPALVSIDKFIRQQLKNEKRINGDQFFGNKISDEESFDRWKLICGVVMRDKFYADKQLDLIAKKIQSFWIIVTKIVDGEINGTTGLPTKSY